MLTYLTSESVEVFAIVEVISLTDMLAVACLSFFFVLKTDIIIYNLLYNNIYIINLKW